MRVSKTVNTAHTDYYNTYMRKFQYIFSLFTTKYRIMMKNNVNSKENQFLRL